MRIVLIPLLLLSVIACTVETRQLFFDIQPPGEEKTALKGRQDNYSMASSSSAGFIPGMGAIVAGTPWSANDNLPPPPIEEIREWEKVEAMMPKDVEGDVDWAAAVRQGIIRPRTGADPRDQLATIFQWDFIIPAVDMEEEDDEDNVADEGDENAEAAKLDEDEDDENREDHEDDAFFPHSSHTQWLGCRNCHMPIYKFRRNFTTMKEKKKGVSCGICHGKVAFSLKTCERCHPNG